MFRTIYVLRFGCVCVCVCLFSMGVQQISFVSRLVGDDCSEMLRNTNGNNKAQNNKLLLDDCSKAAIAIATVDRQIDSDMHCLQPQNVFVFCFVSFNLFSLYSTHGWMHLRNLKQYKKIYRHCSQAQQQQPQQKQCIANKM